MTLTLPDDDNPKLPALSQPVEGVHRPGALEDDPRTELRVGGAIAFLFFVVFLGWAAFAPLDAGAYAHGVVTVSGNRQSVQHRDGGTVSALHVHEGDHVVKGQVLVEIDAAELRATERALTTQTYNLLAMRARLLAESRGAVSFAAPPEFAGLATEDQVIADEAMRLERGQLAARRSALTTQQTVLTARVAQLNQQIAGLTEQSTANQRQQALIAEETEGMRSLAERGYAPENRVRALERTAAGLEGDNGNLQANMARVRDQIGETRTQIVSLQRQQMEDIAKQLSDTERMLGEAQPKLIAARQQLSRALVRAPATGEVVGLSVFTVGGVVRPGDKLMDIVPSRANLVLEAMVNPDDADDLKIGQMTEVRFPAFHERNMPILKGRITKLSADSFMDEKSGQRFFRAEVTVPESEMAVIREVRGAQTGLRPGLPAEIVIPLKKRTALQYILEPLEQRFWKSFREH
ncbi:MAG: HlyD family type I secretion periplasmic adaptor subunit [Caulobacteraceae bacterium]|nr:HlyD family type I secretion periplasmic adaptor subunit [Caulobacteraceae bacterium]